MTMRLTPSVELKQSDSSTARLTEKNRHDENCLPGRVKNMSGGHFNYDQHSIGVIADGIERLIETGNNEETDSHWCTIGHPFPQEVIEKFREAVLILRKAEIMSQRIDWLVSGDDSKESFFQRWNEDLSKIEQPGG